MSQTMLSERISRVLREQKIKTVEFARAVGVTPNYVSQLTGGRKTQVSHSLAKLIETLYGYRAEWITTGAEPVHSPDTLRGLQENTIDEIMRMSGGELRAVAAYIRALQTVADESVTERPQMPAPPDVSQFAERLATLSDAERRVYGLLLQDCGSNETAAALGISANTVKTHTRRIYKKLGVRSRKEAVRLAALVGNEECAE